MLQHGVCLAPSQFEAGFLFMMHNEEVIAATVEAAEAALKAIWGIFTRQAARARDRRGVLLYPPVEEGLALRGRLAEDGVDRQQELAEFFKEPRKRQVALHGIEVLELHLGVVQSGMFAQRGDQTP